MAASLEARFSSLRPLPSLPHALGRRRPGETPHDPLMATLTQRKVLVFLDYDGTLTAIADRPQDAVLHDQGRTILAALCAAVPTAVISGRDRADVQALVGLPGVVYAGSHGFDVDLPGHPSLAPQPANMAALLDQAEVSLRAGIGTIPGTLIERKAVSIAVHYRLVAASDLAAFDAAVKGVLEECPELREKPGKKVRELLPAVNWDKGKCILALLDIMGGTGNDHVALFIGDDRTDEDAFAALRQRGDGGLGIIVADPRNPDDARRHTHAAYRVDDSEQVLALLARVSTAFGPTFKSHS